MISNEFQTVTRSINGHTETITIRGDLPWTRVIKNAKGKSHHGITYGDKTLNIDPLQAILLDTIEQNPQGVTSLDFERTRGSSYTRGSIQARLSNLRDSMRRTFNVNLLEGRAGARGFSKDTPNYRGTRRDTEHYNSKRITYRRDLGSSRLTPSS